jgi:hypothetical protein
LVCLCAGSVCWFVGSVCWLVRLWIGWSWISGLDGVALVE